MIRWGILGCGFIARRMAKGAIAHTEGACWWPWRRGTASRGRLLCRGMRGGKSVWLL